ncbi:MAG: dihydrofolate reductase [Bacteroidales bacterium]|nr:dihydrofolate reductase [Candidatus Scybalocola fimicaballi]
MEISIIVATSKNHVIGRDGGIPWHLSADLKRFKALTTGHPIVMGRRTFDSIGRPLPGRRNIVITRSVDKIEGCDVVKSVEDILNDASLNGEVFILGGGEIYKQFLPYAKKVCLTEVDAEIADGDTFFPELNPMEWMEVNRESHEADEKNDFNYSFVDYVRF